MRRRVPQYFPSKSEGGRSYALESPYHTTQPHHRSSMQERPPTVTRMSLPQRTRTRTTAAAEAHEEKAERYYHHDQDSNNTEPSSPASSNFQLNPDSPARLGAIPFDQTTSLMAGDTSGAFLGHRGIGSYSGGGGSSYSNTGNSSMSPIDREGSTVMTTQEMVASLLSNRSKSNNGTVGQGGGGYGYDNKHRQSHAGTRELSKLQEDEFRLQPVPRNRNSQQQQQQQQQHKHERKRQEFKPSNLPPSFQPPQTRRYPELLDKSTTTGTAQKKEPPTRYSQQQKVVQESTSKRMNNNTLKPVAPHQQSKKTVAKRDMDSDADTNPTLKTETSSSYYQPNNEFFVFNSDEYYESGNDNHTVKTECWSQQHLLSDSHPFFPEDDMKESMSKNNHHHHNHKLDLNRHRQTTTKSSKHRNSSKNKNMLSPIKVLNLISPKKKKKKKKDQPSQAKTQRSSFSRMSSRPLQKQHRHQRLISSSASTSSNVSLSSRDAIRRSKSYRKDKMTKSVNVNKENEENHVGQGTNAPVQRPYSMAKRIQSFGSDIPDIDSNIATVASQSHFLRMENEFANNDNGGIPVEVRHRHKIKTERTEKMLSGNMEDQNLVAAPTKYSSNQYNVCHESMHLDEAGGMFRVESRLDENKLGEMKNPKSKGLKIRSSHDEMSPIVMKDTVNGRSEVVLPEKQFSNRRVNGLLTSHDEMSPIGRNTRHRHNRLASHDEMSPIVKRRHLSPDRLRSSKVNNDIHSNMVVSTPEKSINNDSEFEADFDKSWVHSPIQRDGSFALHVINESNLNGDEVGDREEEDDFINVVASIVIQTFFRRHLAYKVAWKRYNAVLTIQRFLHFRLEQQREEEFVRGHTAANLQMQPYHLAATQIQALFRGWWSRECIKVDVFCATLIQRSYRSYRHQLSTEVCDAAATLIQAHWRRYTAELSFINDFGRILIVQSICRGYIVRSRMRRAKQREERKKYHRPGRLTKRAISSVSAGSSHVLSNASTVLIKNTFGQKSNTARRAHESLKKYPSSDNKRHVSNQVSTALSDFKTSDLIEQWKRRQRTVTEGAKRGTRFDI